MFCTACGAPNADEARFCNQCGARISSAAGSATAGGQPTPTPTASEPPAGAFAPPGEPPAAPAVEPTPLAGTVPASQKLPTLGAGSSVQLPMTGPSRRTLTLAGAGIGLGGAVLGALAGLAALRRPQPISDRPPPETAVALVETVPLAPLPTVADAGAAGVGHPVRAGSAAGRVVAGRGTAGAPAAGGAESGGAAGSAAPARNGHTGTPAGASAPAGGAGGAGGAAHTGGTAGAGSSGAAASNGGGAASAGGGDNPGSGDNGSGAGSGAQAGSGGDNGGSAGNGAGGAGATLPPDPPAGTGGPQAPTRQGYREGAATDATGTMDPAAFNFVYRHYRSQIAACHSNASRSADVRGTIRVRVRLGTDGNVRRTQIVNNSTNSAELAECVQSTIRTWRYPQPEGGEVEFEYNLGFGN